MGWIFQSYVNSDGSQALEYKFSYRGKPIIIPAKVSIRRDQLEKGAVVNHPDKVKIDARVSAIKSICVRQLSIAESEVPMPTPAELKARIIALVENKAQPKFKSLSEYWQECIENYQANEKIDTCLHHKDSKRLILSNMPSVSVADVTVGIVKGAEEKLLRSGYSHSSVNGYIRDLRAVLTRAKDNGLVKENVLMGYRLPSPDKKVNVAMNEEEFLRFLTTELPTPKMNLVRDMFLFRYLCNGMRIRDQLLLRPSDIKSGVLDYRMGKSRKRMRFTLDSIGMEIVRKYQGGKYIFPLLKGGETVEEIKSKIIPGINLCLKRIAKKCGIDKTLSTHSARHTFAFLNRDMNLIYLRDLLGHGSGTTTEIYMGSLTENLDEIRKGVKKIGGKY